MRDNRMVERITAAALRSGEPIFKQPLIELCGEHRVLIEHHKGLGEYSANRIDVKVRFGVVCISGSKLEICQMTAEQLIILGNIDSISLLKESGR